MACGCQAACGCDVIAGSGISVTRLGDTFRITNTSAAIGVPTFVQQAPPVYVGPYIWYELDGSGNLVTIWVENGL